MNGYSNGESITILSRMSVLTDSTRARALRVLERHELTVAELCGILQLPQSTVSRHLKVLADSEWVTWRKDGTSRLYRLPLDELDDPACKLWQLIRDQVSQSKDAGQDDQRLRQALHERRSRSEAFFASVAGQWDKLRGELFGQRFDVTALLGLLDSNWIVGDLGCGTGQVAETVAPFVKKVIAIESSDPMLEAADSRLADIPNAELRAGKIESLPLADNELDVALVMLVMHHVPEPDKAVREARRVLKPNGRLLILDMQPHDRREYHQQMGHLWMGFGRGDVTRWMSEAGFECIRFNALAPDRGVKGPNLFVASGSLPAKTDRDSIDSFEGEMMLRQYA